jgi:hypothetical protein
VMAAQEYPNVIEHRELAGVVVFAIVGVVLVALAPAKQSGKRVPKPASAGFCFCPSNRDRIVMRS